MVITAYFDESGTHGSSELALMAGYIAEGRQWRKYEKRAAKLFGRHRVRVFHSIDLKRGSKDFAGWTVDQKIHFLDEFQHVVNETLEVGFVSILKAADYAYYKSLPWPKGTRPDSLYTILFRASLSGGLDGARQVERWRLAQEPRLHVVLESGHRNAKDAVRIYEFVQTRFPQAPCPLNGLTFEDKKDCLPLAAADLIAYNVYREETGAKPLGQLKQASKAEASYNGNLYRIDLDRDTLLLLNEQSHRFKAERRAAWEAGGQ